MTPWTVAHQAPLARGFFQARTLEWVTMSFSRGSSRPRDGTWVSCIDRWVLYHWATREAHELHHSLINPQVEPPGHMRASCRITSEPSSIQALSFKTGFTEGDQVSRHKQNFQKCNPNKIKPGVFLRWPWFTNDVSYPTQRDVSLHSPRDEAQVSTSIWGFNSTFPSADH